MDASPGPGLQADESGRCYTKSLIALLSFREDSLGDCENIDNVYAMPNGAVASWGKVSKNLPDWLKGLCVLDVCRLFVSC